MVSLEEFFALAPEKLKEWIFISFESGSFSPLKLYAEPALASQMAQIANSSTLAFKERFKKSIAIGLAEWQIRNGLPCLTFLLESTAQMRVTEGLHSIYLMLKAGRLQKCSCEGIWLPGLATAVLTGLSEAPGVLEKLESLVRSGDAALKKLIPQLVRGICRVAPGRFEHLSEDLVDALASDASYFSIPLVVAGILEDVGPLFFEMGYRSLSKDRIEKFIGLIEATGGDRLKVRWGEGRLISYIFFDGKHFPLGSLEDLNPHIAAYKSVQRRVSLGGLRNSLGN